MCAKGRWQTANVRRLHYCPAGRRPPASRLAPPPRPLEQQGVLSVSRQVRLPADEHAREGGYAGLHLWQHHVSGQHDRVIGASADVCRCRQRVLSLLLWQPVGEAAPAGMRRDVPQDRHNRLGRAVQCRRTGGLPAADTVREGEAVR